jgi:hypothetical protein
MDQGAPEIRGWDVRTASGRTLGVVHDVLVDRASGAAHTMDVAVGGGERRVSVPFDLAHVDHRAKVVLMDSADLPGGGASPGAIRSGVGVADQSSRPTRPAPMHGDAPVDRAPAIEEPSRERMQAEGSETRSGDRRQTSRRSIDRVSTDL